VQDSKENYSYIAVITMLTSYPHSPTPHRLAIYPQHDKFTPLYGL